MINSLIIIGIVILIINFIINYGAIVNICKKIREKVKIYDILVNIIFICVIALIGIIIGNKVINTKKDVIMEKEISEDQNKINNYQIEEQEYYKSVINVTYDQQKYNEPYIPEGYTYVEGEWNTGFVIQDENENQYVWVPCTNKEIEGLAKLEKRNFSKSPYMSKDLCYDTEYKDFLASSLKYGGFYIARYEIGKSNEEIPIIKKDSEVWNNIDKEQAIELIKKINNKSNITIQLMNSYSYDTTFEWLIITNREKLKYDVIKSDENGKRYTGNKSYNNIYDLYDTTYEMTTEVYYENTTICRGTAGVYNDVMSGKIKDFDNRTALYSKKKDSLGFRTILYKE